MGESRGWKARWPWGVLAGCPRQRGQQVHRLWGQRAEAVGAEGGKARVQQCPGRTRRLVLHVGPGVGPLITLSPQVDVQLQLAVPQPGRYALVVEYANEDAPQEVGAAVHTPQRAPQQGALTFHPCPYRCAGRGEDSGLGEPCGKAWAPGPPPDPLLTAAAPPAAPCAGPQPWTPSTTWRSSTWTRRPASGSRPSRPASSW